MSYFIAGIYGDGYRVYDSKTGKTLGIPLETLLSLKGTVQFTNAVLESEGLRERNYRGVKSIVKMNGNLRTIVCIDYNKMQFGYITGQLGKAQVYWESFENLPYYDKLEGYRNVYFKGDNGEVYNKAYDVKGEEYPIFFKTYVKDLVESVESVEIAEEIQEKSVEEPQEKAVEESVGVSEVGDTESAEVEENSPEEVIEPPAPIVVEEEKEESLRDLVNRMLSGNKNDTVSFKAIDVTDIYKIMILAQRDDSVVDIPYEVLKSLKYKIRYVLDKDFNMTRMTSLGTMVVDGHELIVITTIEQDNKLSRLQMVKSSRPQRDKNYDLTHIKDNYFKWRLQNRYVGV